MEHDLPIAICDGRGHLSLVSPVRPYHLIISFFPNLDMIKHEYSLIYWYT